MSKGFLLINLGTPSSPEPEDVKRYLTEFLLDPKVIDIPWLLRQILVRGVIIPRRYRESAKSYQKIWTEEGSPLLFHTKNLAKAVEERFGKEALVLWAMRYQNPSILSALKRMKKEGIDDITVLPLFPQYAEATTGSIIKKVGQDLKYLCYAPQIRIIPHFDVAESFGALSPPIVDYDHVLISFHGLPKRQLFKGAPYCYRSQCFQTAKGIAKALDLKNYSICFQSRLGKEEWLKPYASDVIKELAESGVKRLLVFSPSFVSDCLETIYEIGEEYKTEFIHFGGERLDLVPSLNAHPVFVDKVFKMLQQPSCL